MVYYIFTSSFFFGLMFSEFLREKRRENRHRGIRGDENFENEWLIKEYTQWLKDEVVLSFLSCELNLHIKYNCKPV